MASQAQNLQKGIRFVKNFGPELKEIITEAKYFEQLGYSVPEYILHIAVLQDKLYR